MTGAAASGREGTFAPLDQMNAQLEPAIDFSPLWSRAISRQWRRRVGSGAQWAAVFAGLLASAMLSPSLAADPAAAMALGRKLFAETTVPRCAICHTLKDAGSDGAVGPVLDELKPDAKRVAAALRNGLGVMPSYKESLTEEQISVLALYVSRASGGAK